MENDTVMTLVAFGGWIGLLCFALCVAGWIADTVHRRHDKRRSEFDYLTEAVEADRAHRDKLDRAA
jgi:apolipoprotein N-acyltransferase